MTFNDQWQAGTFTGPGNQDSLPEMPRPDQVVNYNVRLSDAKLVALGRRIQAEVRAFEQAMAGRRDLIQLWRRDFEMLPADEDQPWENASAVRAPLTRIDCQQHWSRLNAQVLMQQPPFGVVARDEHALGVTRAIEDVIEATLEEADWARVARKVHQEIVVTGNCLVRVQWVTRTQRAVRHPVNLDEEAFATHLQAGAPVAEALLASVDTDEEGRIAVEIELQDQVIKDGVELAIVPHEDMIVLPTSARTMDDVWGIGERIRIRGLDLKEGARTGKYLKRQVETLLKRQGDAPDPDDDEAETLSNVAQEYGGEDDNPLYRSYECVELCWFDDLNGDGRMEWYVITVYLADGLVLRCQYMPYEHGRPYYVPFRYIERVNQFWGMGIAELVATLQTAATHAINNHQNLTDMIAGMAGNFFYDSRAGLNVDTFRYSPGVPFRVNNVEGIRPMIENAASIPPALRGMQESLAIFRDWSDLLTANSNTSLGKEAQSDKTLGEIRLVMGQAMQVFSDYAAGVLLSWADVADQVRWLRGQYNDRGLVRYRRVAAPGKLIQGDQGISPGGEVFQINPANPLVPVRVPFQGPVGFGAVPADVLLADVDIVPAGLGQIADQQTRFQRSLLVLQTLMTHPLTAGDPEIQANVIDAFLQDVNFPGRAGIMEKVQQAVLAAQQQQQAQQVAMMMLPGTLARQKTTATKDLGNGRVENSGEPPAR